MRGDLPLEKKYHLSEAQMNEIRKLRAADPAKWTRSALAKQFGVSSWFIATVSRVPKERKLKLDSQLEERRSKWGEEKRTIMEIRKKRRGLW
jgi:hypothetical protein